MKFIDQTEIHVHAGDGGNGMVSFRRARNMPKLGPDGGNGGTGADVLLQAVAGLNTLSSLRYRQVYRAEHGGKGGTNNKTGACGQALLIPVPLGTVVYDRQEGQKLGELLHAGQTLMVAKGGKHGYGNLHFVSATNRAPHFASNGQAGEHRTLRLELKLLADVGLAGFPNAGKSTLLSRISAARPKIADYPFTTLTPQLGVVDVGEDGQSFVVADVPGLIAGASEGRGLGHEFLRHLERTKIIAYVLEGLSLTVEEESLASPLQSQACLQLQQLQREMGQYSATMLTKKALIVLNKADLIQSEQQKEYWQALYGYFQQQGYEVASISAATGQGLEALKYKLAELLVPEAEPLGAALEQAGFPT